MAIWNQTAPPAKEPLDLQSLIEWQRLPCSADEPEPGLPGLLAAAREQVENRTGLSLMTQQWRLTLDRWPSSGIVRLPRGPLWLGGSPVALAVAIAYTDADGGAQTLDAADYLIDAESRPPRIMPAYGLSWPSLRAQMNAVRITYSAGVDDPDDVPQTLRTAIRMLLAHWYENREVAITDGQPRTFPLHIEQILADETIPQFDPDE